MSSMVTSMVLKLHLVQRLLKSSGVQEMQFPQFSYNNSISVSGSHFTEAIHRGLCAFVPPLFLRRCEVWELM